MTNLDLREAFNVVSEVVVNRPEALREFDQIYMKISDMLLHAELVSRWTDGKSMVFLGDGDAIGLTLTYLKDRKVLDRGPAHVHVLDFDERIVNSVLSITVAHTVKVPESVSCNDTAWHGPGGAVSSLTIGWSA